MDEKRGLKFRGAGMAVVLCAVLILFPARANLAQAAEPGSVQLDAERVSYDDETGRAVAEGDAVLNYEGATIRAERIDYDAVTQKVKASPLPGESVTLDAMGRRVTGDSLEYDLDTGEGVLTGPKTSVGLGEGILYISGGSIEVYPYEYAAELGVIHPRAGDDVSWIGRWQDVSATTCALDHPHYRIETNSITFVPGRRLIAKRPRLYMGSTYLFTWPMDYIVLIERRALKYSVMPYIQSTQNKGTGFGFSGALGWDSGSLGIGVSYWDKVDLEWMAEIDQSLGGGFGIRGGVEYSWDKPWNEKIYRPYGTLYYERDGWKAAVNWTRDEYIEDRKDSRYEYQGRLDREPEFMLNTPWFRHSTLGASFSGDSWYSLGVTTGSYRESIPAFTNNTVTRYGAHVRHYLEMPVGNAAQFFWNVRYGMLYYDTDDADQQMAEGIAGVRYRFGDVSLASGYERRSVWGESPMSWDSYRRAERIHQKIRFPLGGEFYAQVRGSYDLRDSLVDEVTYALQWINDCMKWELQYRNDRTSEGDDKINLNVSILAFPDTPASFGQYEDRDPFDPPEDLPNRNNKNK